MRLASPSVGGTWTGTMTKGLIWLCVSTMYFSIPETIIFCCLRQSVSQLWRLVRTKHSWVIKSQVWVSEGFPRKDRREENVKNVVFGPTFYPHIHYLFFLFVFFALLCFILLCAIFQVVRNYRGKSKKLMMSLPVYCWQPLCKVVISYLPKNNLCWAK